MQLLSKNCLNNFLTLIVLLLCFTNWTIAQITFQKTYGGTADEDIGNLIEASDGGYVVVGTTKSCTQTIADLCIFKTDKSGNLQWAKSYGDNGTGNVNIAATEDGYIIAGTVQVPGNGYDILVTRTDTGGNVLWKKTFGGSQDDYGNAIYHMRNGEYVVLGYTRNYGAGGWDAFAMRITGNGDVVWFKTYGTYTTDLANRLVEESDGSLIMTGTTYISGTHNMLLLKTDSLGNLLWAKQYSFSGDESGYGIARASNGDYLIVTCAYMSSTDANVLLYRTSPEGVLRWAKIYLDTHFPGKIYFAGFDVATLPDGNILLAGEWAGASQENQCDGLFMKVDSVGSILSSKTYGGSGTDFFRTLLLTKDGGCLLGGKTNSQGTGGYDVFIVKTDTGGNSGTSMGIFPDYASPIVTESSVSLTTLIYNITGQSSQFSRNGNACWNSLPFVVSVTPLHNALNIAQNSNITATFSSDINSSTLTNSTVKINGSLSGIHPSLFGYNSNTRTLTITPNTSFKIGELVTVTLTRGIMSAIGDSLSSSYSWSFTVKTNTSSGLFQQSSTVGVGNTPWYLAAADFNGDGAIDLAVVNNYSNDVSILTNNGNGIFTKTSTVDVGSYPNSITTADLDSDGDMDLVVTNSGSNTVSILKNDGNGKFTQTSAMIVKGYPWNVAAADLDGDGTIDLAVTSYSGTVSILKNDGSGSFTLTSTVTVGSIAYSVTAADLNSDGAIDLAVTNYGSNSVSILTNNGSGTFTRTSTMNVGNGPCAIAATDLDGDGVIDLAVANLNSNTISILKNNGSGTFTLTSTVNTGNSPTSVIAVDDDGNGVMDLAIVNAGSGSVSVLKNDGNGSFATTSTVSTGVGSSPRIVTAADLDSDGRIDLAVVNLNFNSVSIIKNRSSSATIDISSSLLSYGSVSVGSSKSEYLKIYNSGTDSSLFISNITSSNVAFIVNRTSFTIAASECDSILVTFLPTTKGAIFNDSLILTSNDAEKPNVKVSLTGSSTFSQPQVAFTINLGGPIYAGISILGDNTMYAIASGDAVYRMNAAGTVIYTLQVAGDVRSSSSIAYDTTVYIASSDRNLYTFSKDGNSLWPPLPTGGVLTATPTIDSITNRVYIGVSNHNFIAVNRLTGTVAWNYFADAQIRNSAVVTSDRKLVFATQKGTLYGFDLNNLTLPATPTWQIALPDTTPSSIALDNQGYIYVGTSAGCLLKISMPANQQPSIMWQVPLGQAIIGSPVIDATGTLYVGSLDAKLYAVDIQSGAVKWAFSTKGAIRSTPAISDAGNIYVANDSGEVISLDASKNILWYYKTSGAIAAPLLYYKSTLYIGTLGNQVIALYDGADSSQTLSLSKSDASHEITGKPVWATFQGNNQRTGMFSTSGTTGIKNSSVRPPTDYALMQNYPNPFNPSTTIQFALPKDGRVSIKIFNMLGQHIATLIDGFQSAGYHEVTFDIDSDSSGIYFYQMIAGTVVQTKKMLLMK